MQTYIDGHIDVLSLRRRWNMQSGRCLLCNPYRHFHCLSWSSTYRAANRLGNPFVVGGLYDAIPTPKCKQKQLMCPGDGHRSTHQCATFWGFLILWMNCVGQLMIPAISLDEADPWTCRWLTGWDQKYEGVLMLYIQIWHKMFHKNIILKTISLCIFILKLSKIRQISDLWILPNNQNDSIKI